MRNYILCNYLNWGWKILDVNLKPPERDQILLGNMQTSEILKELQVQGN